MLVEIYILVAVQAGVARLGWGTGCGMGPGLHMAGWEGSVEEKVRQSH